MRDKIVVITGATNGIGYVTARELAAQGARMILVGRNTQKCERTVQRIKAATGNTAIEFACADLSAQGEVRRLAAGIAAAHDRIDVLVNNAGAIYAKRRLSADGIEMTFALNHLSYFLLTDLLLDRLRAAPRGRIVNVASNAHVRAQLDFDDLQNERPYKAQVAYGRSKLANLYFSFELARRLDGTSITANALHPGFVRTGIGHDNGLVFSTAVRLYQLLGGAIDVEKGADTSIYLASSPDVDRLTGRYFVERRDTPSSDVSYDEDAARRLWDISVEMVQTGLRRYNTE